MKITEWKYFPEENKNCLSYYFLVLFVTLPWQFKTTSCRSIPPSLQKKMCFHYVPPCTNSNYTPHWHFHKFSMQEDLNRKMRQSESDLLLWMGGISLLSITFRVRSIFQYYGQVRSNKHSLIQNKSVWVSESLDSPSSLISDWPLRWSFRFRPLCREIHDADFLFFQLRAQVSP